MTERKTNPWQVDHVDEPIVERLAAHHRPHAEAVAMSVDIVGDPHRENDDGYNWTLLSYARNLVDVVPGSAVVMGSAVGRYLAKVIAWDFEVSDEDPIVVLELVPLTPQSVEKALARSRT